MCFFPLFSNNILANVPKIINYYLDSVVTFKAVRFFFKFLFSNFYLLSSRAWELFLGSMLSFA
jgi:hypothetical protein